MVYIGLVALKLPRMARCKSPENVQELRPSCNEVEHHTLSMNNWRNLRAGSWEVWQRVSQWEHPEARRFEESVGVFWTKRLRRLHQPCLRLAVFLLASPVTQPPTDVVAQPIVTSLQRNGLVTWTDPGHESNSLYHVEWAPALGASWQPDWSGLQYLEMGGVFGSVQVPMFYRVARDTNSAAIAGSWGNGWESQTRVQTLTFYPDGHYLQWITDSSTTPVREGVEIGNYSYDATHHTLSVTSSRDDNGNLGLTDFQGQTRMHSVFVTGDTMMLKTSAGPVFKNRAKDSAWPLVGGWSTGHNDAGTGYLTVTFYPNGYYVHWQTADPTPDTKEGVEYGIYTYDPATKHLTAVAMRDDNGTMGLCGDSHWSIGQGRYQSTMTITNNMILEFGAPRVQ